MEEKAASDFQEAPRTENRKNWFRGSFLRRFGFESVCLTDSGAVESRHSECERKFSGTFAGMISVVLILLFYAGWFTVIERENPKYLRDFRAAVNPDAVTYVQLGKNIWQEGVYSRNTNPPYQPDFKWTPVFPVLAGLADWFGGVRAILFLNVGLMLLSAFLLARIAFYWTRSRRTAFLIFVFLALDPLIWSVTLQAMSDLMFLFFLILGVYWAFPALFSLGVQKMEGFQVVSEKEFSRKTGSLTENVSDRKSKFRKIFETIFPVFAGGIAFSLAILTRPSGLYVPFIPVIALSLAFVFGKLRDFLCSNASPAGKRFETSAPDLRNRLTLAAVFLLAAFLPVLLWMSRNAEVFGKFALCGNQNIVMVYYTGGGAWQTANDCSLEEAQEKIKEEFGLPPAVQCHNPEAFGLDQGKLDTQLAECKREVLTRYPKALLFSSCVGVGKSLLAHETEILRQIAHGNGSMQESGSVEENGLVKESSSLEKSVSLEKNDSMEGNGISSENVELESGAAKKRSWIFYWSILFQGTILLLVPVFGVKFRREAGELLRRNPALFLVLAGWGAYFVLTMMLSGIDCCARYRLPLMPLFYFAAALVLGGPKMFQKQSLFSDAEL